MQDPNQQPWMYPPSQPHQNSGQWVQSPPPANPFPYQQPVGAPWMTSDQYIAAQMHMAAMYTHPASAAPTYGTFWHRLGAYLIDALLIVILYFIGESLVGAAGGPDAVETLQDWGQFGYAGSIITNATVTALIVSFNAIGGTPGKRMLGLRITNREGGLPGLALAVVRAWPWIVVLLCNIAFYFVRQNSTDPDSTLLDAVSKLAQLIWFVGCFFVLGTTYKQALHDKAAGTYVIKG